MNFGQVKYLDSENGPGRQKGFFEDKVFMATPADQQSEVYP